MTKLKQISAKAMVPIVAGAAGGIVATLYPVAFEAFCAGGL